MADWPELIDNARFNFELGNYEDALVDYKDCIEALNNLIQRTDDDALRNKAIEVRRMPLEVSD
jgi:hypothetical protein